MSAMAPLPAFIDARPTARSGAATGGSDQDLARGFAGRDDETGDLVRADGRTDSRIDNRRSEEAAGAGGRATTRTRAPFRALLDRHIERREAQGDTASETAPERREITDGAAPEGPDAGTGTAAAADSEAAAAATAAAQRQASAPVQIGTLLELLFGSITPNGSDTATTGDTGTTGEAAATGTAVGTADAAATTTGSALGSAPAAGTTNLLDTLAGPAGRGQQLSGTSSAALTGEPGTAAAATPGPDAATTAASAPSAAGEMTDTTGAPVATGAASGASGVSGVSGVSGASAASAASAATGTSAATAASATTAPAAAPSTTTVSSAAIGAGDGTGTSESPAAPAPTTASTTAADLSATVLRAVGRPDSAATPSDVEPTEEPNVASGDEATDSDAGSTTIISGPAPQHHTARAGATDAAALQAQTPNAAPLARNTTSGDGSAPEPVAGPTDQSSDPAITAAAPGGPRTTTVQAGTVNAATAPARPAPAEPPAQQVVRALTPLLNRPDGTYTLHLELRPVELGRVEIEVHMRGGRLDVTMRAENASAAAALNDSLTQLRDALRTTGVQTGALSVDQHHHGSQARSNADAHRQTLQARRGSGSNPTDGSGGAGSGPVAASPVGNPSASALDLRM